MDVKKFEIELIGVKPLLMHNVQGANPTNVYTKMSKEYSSKRTKTDEDHEMLSKISFLSSCYWNEEEKFYIPSENIEAAFCNGAKNNKLGKKAKLAFTVDQLNIPLIHKAPANNPEDLWNYQEFSDCRLVNVQRSKVLRTRARFDQWRLKFTCTLNSEIMNLNDFIRALNDAGQFAGIGDYRPKYGLFEAIIKEI